MYLLDDLREAMILCVMQIINRGACACQIKASAVLGKDLICLYG